MGEQQLRPAAIVAMIVVAVLGYQFLCYVEAWTIETLCREILRCN